MLISGKLRSGKKNLEEMQKQIRVGILNIGEVVASPVRIFYASREAFKTVKGVSHDILILNNSNFFRK